MASTSRILGSNILSENKTKVRDKPSAVIPTDVVHFPELIARMPVTTTTMTEARVLEEILKTLQRLETRLDGQNNRLGAIEASIWSKSSGTLSSRAGGSFSLPSDRGFSSPERGQEPLSPVTPPSSHHPRSPASIYKVSIAELRKRFEFVDDSCPDLGVATATDHLHQPL